MNYIVDQSASTSRDAGPKARRDVNRILTNHGYRKLELQCSQDPSIGAILHDFISMAIQLRRHARSTRSGDLFVVQYPFRCSSVVATSLMRSALRRRGARSVVLVHDMFSLYGGQGIQSFGASLRDDVKLLSCFDAVVVHNGRMKEFLVDHGLNGNTIIELDFFDYLVDESLPGLDSSASFDAMDKRIVIAGNLSPVKAGYLSHLSELESDMFGFDLYGVGYEGEQTEFCRYMGSFDPDTPPLLQGIGFGLVWDGDSLDGCEGVYGEYLRFNNPHKLSLYLACGLPVIVWKEAAVCEMVEELGVGLSVSSLRELSAVMGGLSDSEYRAMAVRAAQIGRALRAGSYTADALEKAVLSIA